MKNGIAFLASVWLGLASLGTRGAVQWLMTDLEDIASAGIAEGDARYINKGFEGELDDLLSMAIDGRTILTIESSLGLGTEIDCTWSVATGASWLSLTSTESGASGNGATVRGNPNTDGVSRYGIVKLTKRYQTAAGVASHEFWFPCGQTGDVVTKGLNTYSAAGSVRLYPWDGDAGTGSGIDAVDLKGGWTDDNWQCVSEDSSMVWIELDLSKKKAYYYYKRNNSSEVRCIQTTMRLGGGSGQIRTWNFFAPKPPETLSACTNFSATDAEVEKVVCTWSAVTGATRYKVFRDGSLIGSTTSCRYTDTTMEYDTRYTYSVIPVKESGGSDVAVGPERSDSGTALSEAPVADVTITFNPNGGTVGETSRKCTPGETYGSLPIPTKKGFAFAGWYTKSSGGDRVTASSTVPARSATLYAQWQAGTYRLTFGKNGGTGGDDWVTVAYGAKPHDITPPKRAGYAFGGYWTTTGSGGVQYYNASGKATRAWDKTSGTTLWAKWTANGYVVTFGKNGGTGGTSTLAVKMGVKPSGITPPSKTGYAFGGYWTTTGAGGVQYFAADGNALRTWDRAANVTLWAKWTANKYRLTFNKDGGTGGDNYVTVAFGAKPHDITHPKLRDFIFGGYALPGSWVKYYDEKGKAVRVWDKASDATLKAYWHVAAKYKVTLGKNGGTGGASYVTVCVQSTPHDVQIPTKTGSVFCGYWTSVQPGGVQYFDATGKAVREWDKAGNVTLWAKWSNKITFGKNGGTGGDNYVTAYQGVLPHDVTIPKLAGYAFGGYWTTVKTGGVQYFGADGKALRKWDKTSNVTLWAKWSKAVYKISYADAKGAANPNPTTYTMDDAITFKALPNVTGYTFVRWNPTQIAKGSTGNKTVTAVWNPNKYRVTYRPGKDGEGSAISDVKTYGVSLSLKGAIFTRWGFRQTGWSTQDGGAKVYELGGAYAKNAAETLYPYWTPLPKYTVTYDPGYYGTGACVTDTQLVGEPIDLRKAIFTRAGGAQTGWTTVEGEFKEYELGETYTQQKSITLYPVWTAYTAQQDLRYQTSVGQVWITGYTGSGGDLVLPAEIEGKPVVGIEHSAFSGESTITSVLLPPSITTIRHSAFRGCSNLTRINLPEGLKTIEEYTFFECTKLRSIDIPQSVTWIAEKAFESCEALTKIEIPASVNTIGPYAFEDCYGLREVKMCEGLVHLQAFSFSGCRSLRSVVIPGSIQNMERYVFYNCSSLTDVRIGEGIRTLGDWTFSNCASLSSVVIPSSVKTVGFYMFNGCSALIKIVFLGDRPVVNEAGNNFGSAVRTTMSAPSSCVFYAIDGAEGWGFMPTTWDGHTVKSFGAYFPCTIMFLPNSGTGEMDDLVCATQTGTYQLPNCAFTPPAGKKFAGWQATDGKRYAGGASVSGLRSLGGILTMTAIWE